MSKHPRTWYANELREFAAYPICPDTEDCETLRHCADLIESNTNSELLKALKIARRYVAAASPAAFTSELDLIDAALAKAQS